MPRLRLYWMLLWPTIALGHSPKQEPRLDARPVVDAETRNDLLRYLKATLKGVDKMRGKTGWPVDGLSCDCRNGSEKCSADWQATSLTNIGLDMLSNLELMQRPPMGGAEFANGRRELLEKSVQALEKVPFHPDTGLFYTWYDIDDPTQVRNDHVSAIDNYHMALALWTLARSLPANDPLAIRARKLGDRMDFSVFAEHTELPTSDDAKRKLFGGNLEPYEEIQSNGAKVRKWRLQEYRLGHWGSETRSMYATLEGMGALKKITPSFGQRALSHMTIETGRDSKTNAPLLRTWDGGAFQLLLPDLLLGESRYSKKLGSYFQNHVDRTLRRGREENYPYGIPAGHSASQGFSKADSLEHSYSGHYGDLDATAVANDGPLKSAVRKKWESVVTPHAVFLGTPYRPREIAQRMKGVEKAHGTAKQADECPIYSEERGWLDGIGVDAAGGQTHGRPVPRLLALDQTMIAMSLTKTLSSDGLTASSRAIANPGNELYEPMRAYYSKVDRRL